MLQFLQGLLPNYLVHIQVVKQLERGQKIRENAKRKTLPAIHQDSGSLEKMILQSLSQYN